MLFLYDLMSCIGYFLIMIIFMVIAIVTAKGKGAWIWYAIGAILQLLSLSGNQKVAAVNGTDTTMHWIVYFALLIITAVIVVKRYNKTSASSDKDNEQ
ncbi:MAG: hypothetical protein IJO00_02595 [Clostridia bacterium]|nr:hypothetical protein [Clostridia bacterium]